jgi:hypothetical protein
LVAGRQMVDMLNLYESRFLPPAAGLLAAAQFQMAAQMDGEQIATWHERLRSIFKRAFPGANIQGSRLLINKFTLKLANATIRQWTHRANPATYNAAMKAASNEAASQSILAHEAGGGKLSINAFGGGRHGSCHGCGSYEHHIAACPLARQDRYPDVPQPQGGGQQRGGKRKGPGEYACTKRDDHCQQLVTSDVTQSIIGMNIIGPRRLVIYPVTCTIDFRDEGTTAALGVLGQREDGTIADVRVLKATTILGWHGQLLKLGLFNAEHHRVHTSAPTLVDMDIMAAAVTTDAMGGFLMHIPNADYEDREIKRGTLMGKAHRLSDWIPIDANAAIKMAKKRNGCCVNIPRTS